MNQGVLTQNLDRSEALEEPAPSFSMTPIIAFVALWLGGSSLIIGAWMHPWIPGGWSTLLAALALFILPVRIFIRGLRGQTYPKAYTRLLILRPFWYAMLFAPLLAGSALLGGLIGLPWGASGTVGRWSVVGSAALLASLALVGFIGSRRLLVRDLEVGLPRLPKAFDGLRVVQLSDLHVGPHTSKSFLKRIVRAVENSRPDLIVVTGDQVDDFAEDVEIFNRAFADLKAPLGTYIIAGNHDIYAGWEAVEQGLSKGGFRVLVNEATPLDRKGDRLWIAGTGDPAARSPLSMGQRDASPNIGRTLAAVPADEPVLALAHNPAVWPALAKHGVDLCLSGHTHYGQFAIPSLQWSAASPFLELAMGAHRAGRSLLYIHPGTNFWGIPFRVGTPPEVAVLTLRQSQDGNATFREAV